eukprot:IDg20937t1
MNRAWSSKVSLLFTAIGAVYDGAAHSISKIFSCNTVVGKATKLMPLYFHSALQLE